MAEARIDQDVCTYVAVHDIIYYFHAYFSKGAVIHTLIKHDSVKWMAAGLRLPRSSHKTFQHT